jgi:hypothetical protein
MHHSTEHRPPARKGNTAQQLARTPSRVTLRTRVPHLAVLCPDTSTWLNPSQLPASESFSPTRTTQIRCHTHGNHPHSISLRGAFARQNRTCRINTAADSGETYDGSPTLVGCSRSYDIQTGQPWPDPSQTSAGNSSEEPFLHANAKSSLTSVKPPVSYKASQDAHTGSSPAHQQKPSRQPSQVPPRGAGPTPGRQPSHHQRPAAKPLARSSPTPAGRFQPGR